VAGQYGGIDTSESTAAPIPTVVLSQPMLRIEDFLDSEQMNALLGRVLDLKDVFVPSEIATDVPNYRRSWVVYDLGNARTEIVPMILACVPMLRQVFGVPDGEPSLIEAQLTVSDDGDFFKVHTDCGSPETDGRLVSFVYYFSSEQAAFTGGDLILYDSPVSAPSLLASTRHMVPPTRNSIVFFRSTVWHEVTPVVNPSGQFGDGRFTVNGWLHWGLITAAQKTQLRKS
jgi:SM-20-related protein